MIGKGDDGALGFGRHAINRVGAGTWCCIVRRDIVCVTVLIARVQWRVEREREKGG